MRDMLKWILIGLLPTMVLGTYILDRRYRVTILVRVGETETVVTEQGGRELFRLSNRIVTRQVGSSEQIIAVGTPGQIGYASAIEAPVDAEDHDLMAESRTDAVRSERLWGEFLRFCAYSAISMLRPTKFGFRMARPNSSVFVEVGLGDASVRSAIGRFVQSRGVTTAPRIRLARHAA